jgi:hypothetical protein
MATLASLKLVAAKKPTNQSPTVNRRNKLCAKLQEQILLATAHNDGGSYAPTRLKTATNAAGERVQVTHVKRIKPWWFVSENGKVCISIRYGAKLIELAKGKTAIEISSQTALVEALETVKAAVQAGELDAQIEQASATLREGFGK